MLALMLPALLSVSPLTPSTSACLAQAKAQKIEILKGKKVKRAAEPAPVEPAHDQGARQADLNVREQQLSDKEKQLDARAEEQAAKDKASKDAKEAADKHDAATKNAAAKHGKAVQSEFGNAANALDGE